MNDAPQPVAVGVDASPAKSAGSPSAKIKPLNPNALVWSTESQGGRSVSPQSAPGQRQQVVSPPQQLFTAYPLPGTPPASNIRPMSPGQTTHIHNAQGGALPQGGGTAEEIAAYQMQQEFIHGRNIVQMTPRPVLVAVLLSLLDDFPHLAATVRHRCERGTATIIQQQQAGGAPLAGGLPPQPWGSPQQQQQDAILMAAATAGTTPPSQQRRRVTTQSAGRGTRDEEQQELCGVHNNLRAVKHLHFNHSSGQHECVHGFHCLVDGTSSRDVSAPPSNSVTPKKEEMKASRQAAPEAPVDVARLQNLLDNVRLANQNQ